MRQNQGQTSNPRGEKAHTAYQAVGWAAGAPRVDGQVAPPFVCTSYRTAPSHSRALQLPNVLRPAHQMRPQVARVCGKPRGTSSRPLKGPASDSQLSRPRLLLTPRGSSIFPDSPVVLQCARLSHLHGRLPHTSSGDLSDMPGNWR